MFGWGKSRATSKDELPQSVGGSPAFTNLGEPARTKDAILDNPMGPSHVFLGESKKIENPFEKSLPLTSENLPEQTIHQLQEYERKIRVLSQCLEEKAEENITLFDQKINVERKLAHFQKEAESAKDLEMVVSELNSMLRQKDEEFENLKEELQIKDKERSELLKLNEEFERRIRVLSTCLEEMAQENLVYWNTPKSAHTSHVEANPPADAKKLVEKSPSYHSVSDASDVPVGPQSVEAKLLELTLKQDLERALEEKTHLEVEISKVKEELNSAEQKLQTKEKRIVQLNTKLMDAVNKKTSYQESNELYEQKLKSLEKELMENLHQEGIRRQEAEYVASKLKKKVAELQFLLEERDQSSDSSYGSEDEDFN